MVYFPYCSPIVLLLFSYCSPIVLLSFSYWEAENNTETIRNRTNDERMRNGGTRVVNLTIYLISYDNGKTQTNCGCQHVIYRIIGCTSAIQTSLIAFGLHDNPDGKYFRINLVSFSVRSPFVLRSFSVRSPFVLRSFSVRESENERRTKRDVTTTHRC